MDKNKMKSKLMICERCSKKIKTKRHECFNIYSLLYLRKILKIKKNKYSKRKLKSINHQKQKIINFIKYGKI